MLKLLQLASGAIAFILLLALSRSWVAPIIYVVTVTPLTMVGPVLRSPVQRSLTLDTSAVITSTTTKVGEVPWTEVVRIEDEGNRIFIIRRNLNGFVVPRTAFATESARRSFLTEAEGLLAAAKRQQRP
jgi:hypothetical protein